MTIKLESVNTGSIYNINCAEITEDMVSGPVDSFYDVKYDSEQGGNVVKTAPLKTWKWSNEETNDALEYYPGELRFSTTAGIAGQWWFNPPFDKELPGIMATDLYQLAVQDYVLSGRNLRPGFDPAGSLNQDKPLNRVMFKVLSAVGEDGGAFYIYVDVDPLAGNEKYIATQFPETLYRPDVLYDAEALYAVYAGFIGNGQYTSTTYSPRVRIVGDSGTYEDYTPGKGLSRMGLPKFYLIYNPIQECLKRPGFNQPYELTPYPNLYLASPTETTQSGNVNVSARAPSLVWLNLANSTAEAIEAAQDETTSPTTLPGLENYIDPKLTGMVYMYIMNQQNSVALASVLWDDSFWAKLRDSFTSPLDGVISYHVLPLTEKELEGGLQKEIKLGPVSTGIMATAAAGVVKKELGGIGIPATFNNFLDYETQLTIYLPYVGFQPLDANRYMGKTIHITYHIDVMTGTGICFLHDAFGNVHASYVCDMARKIPVTDMDYGNTVRNIFQALGGTAAMAGSIVSGNVPGIVSGFGAAYEAGVSLGIGAGSVRHVNGVSSAPSQMAGQYPYVIIERPISAVSDSYGTYSGLPDYNTINLSSLSGFAKVTNPILNVTSTQEEEDEIASLLEGGVFF